MDRTSPPDYTAEPVMDNARLTDVRVVVEGKVRHLAGRSGIKRELAEADSLGRGSGRLPVFLGSGLGLGIERLLENHPGPIAVVDKEEPILSLTRAREKLADRPGLLWVDDSDPAQALNRLTRWQMDNGGLPFAPLANPFYLRLDPDYYGLLRQSLAASSSFDFWAKARYPKFKSWPPRILMVSSKYFLMGEIVAASERLGVPHRFINIDNDEIGTDEFLRRLLEAVLEFKPDFVFTINHLGVDREGILADLLNRLELPLASWFVDNPHLILYYYANLAGLNCAIFTWDADNIDSLKELGFSNVFYLPLGADANRFKPLGRPAPKTHPWRARVSFVGNSMLTKVGMRLKASRPPRPLLLKYRELAREFGERSEPLVNRFLKDRHPDLFAEFQSLDTMERRLAFEAMITWEATRQYRRRCVAELLPFSPLIAGDKGWNITFRDSPHAWRWRPELNYYDDLPQFYPLSDINFNCTSKQMKGAVNQRVFDVPATNSFLLTDWRVQIENLFEPGKEAAVYKEPEEIPDLVRFYLKNESARKKIAAAARARILDQHTYDKRLTDLMLRMRRVFG